jgi:hypothetical protein
VDINFTDSASNASAGIEIPRGANITYARIDIEGLGGYSDDVRMLDLDRWDVDSPHRAWQGWVMGNYPPTYPHWDPNVPRGANLTRFQYAEVGTSDDDHLDTLTGSGAIGRYPFHMFRFQVPVGTTKSLRPSSAGPTCSHGRIPPLPGYGWTPTPRRQDSTTGC